MAGPPTPANMSTQYATPAAAAAHRHSVAKAGTQRAQNFGLSGGVQILKDIDHIIGIEFAHRLGHHGAGQGFYHLFAD